MLETSTFFLQKNFVIRAHHILGTDFDLVQQLQEVSNHNLIIRNGRVDLVGNSTTHSSGPGTQLFLRCGIQRTNRRRLPIDHDAMLIGIILMYAHLESVGKQRVGNVELTA